MELSHPDSAQAELERQNQEWTEIAERLTALGEVELQIDAAWIEEFESVRPLATNNVPLGTVRA